MAFADLLGAIRLEIKGSHDEPGRARILKALADDEVFHAFLAGGEQAVRERLGQLSSELFRRP